MCRDARRGRGRGGANCGDERLREERAHQAQRDGARGQGSKSDCGGAVVSVWRA